MTMQEPEFRFTDLQASKSMTVRVAAYEVNA